MAAEIKLFLCVILIFFTLKCVRTLNNDNNDADVAERLLILEDLLAEMENIVLETDVKVSEALDKLDDSKDTLMRDVSRLQNTAAKHARKSYKKSRKDVKKELSYDSTILKEMIQTVENINTNKIVGDRSDEIVEDTSSSEIISNQTQGTLDSEIVQSEDMSESRIMFKATMLTEQQYHPGDTIIFPKTINNFGEGYDSDYGIFVTPRRGTYYFTVQLHLYGGRGVDVGVFVGDECITWTKMTPYHDSCNNLAAITRLNVGDVVYVKQLSDPWGKVFKSLKSDLWNTFSGVLIR
ncbi:uncharacterized protein LOC123534544 [Mercenaria mercenaria]|uniref:uncharacterized protein LOC123534544 n=1 Tax=Mercenaria mercenaria TaxID=6596 RepID=UPI00234E405A|nr:uncharacterized protein LOC123534544 [Mercenaria mercenaria]